MMNTNTMTMNQVVALTAKEAGIKEYELFTVEVIRVENGLCEMILTTEWNTIECYTDMTTGEVLGLMATSKPMDEQLVNVRAA